MKKWSNKIKKGLGLEQKSFQGEGRRLGGATTADEQGRPQAARAQPNIERERQRLHETNINSVTDNMKVREGSSAASRKPLRIVATANYPEVADALSSIYSDRYAMESLQTIYKILKNIMDKPEENKMRRLRLSNAKIQRCIVDTNGGMELLLACGFIVTFEKVTKEAFDRSDDNETEEGFAILPMEESLDKVKAAASDIFIILPSNTSAGKVDPNDPNPPVHGRNTILEVPTHINVQLPEWFFQQSSAEIRMLYRENMKKQEQSKLLMTRAMRDKLEKRNRLADTIASTFVIKVRAPEGTTIRGDFNPGEPIQALFAWVAECLVDPMQEFDLIMPDRSKLGCMKLQKKTLKQAGLSYSLTLNLAWQGLSLTQMKNRNTFREDI